MKQSADQPKVAEHKTVVDAARLVLVLAKVLAVSGERGDWRRG